MSVTEGLTALEIGDLVNRREVSPVEVMKECQERIQKDNPKLNAFVYTKFDEAMEEARRLEQQIAEGHYGGRFAGVPVGLKDFLPTKKGWTASHGGVKSMITVDVADSQFYKAVSRLGAIAVGKTNAPAFGFRGTCDNKMYGPTCSPYNTECNSGGSSGGSGAAVGGGLVPIAEGGDAGGSIRIPAAWCGCFGFKPSAGLVPSVCRPDGWTATHPYCCGGPITRSVEDAAIIIEAMKGYNPRDPISVPLPYKDYRHAVFKGVKGMRIALTYDFNLFPTPDPDIVEAIHKAGDMLRSAGAIVDEVTFHFNYRLSEIEEAWLRGISIDSAIDSELDPEHFGLYMRADDLPEELLEWADIALSSTMLDYRTFHDIRTDILDAHQDVLDQYDAIIAPVTGCLPVPNSNEGLTKGPECISGKPVDPLIGFAYTYLENMIGTPAASVPVGLSRTGLPIGLQVIGRRYFDETVFSICGAIEQLTK